MSDILNIGDFLEPVSRDVISDDIGYKDGQIGKNIAVNEGVLPDLAEADIVIVGCAEIRGSWQLYADKHAPDAIRQQFYSLYLWHDDIRMADMGNVVTGAHLNDTYAALKTVIAELNDIGKTVIVLGGSHDLTLAQYQAYSSRQKIVEATVVDALIDLSLESPNRSENFLMEVLTGEPNFIKHYNHIAFQSYYVHPHMLETMDKLRFDCFRVGNVKENMEEMEPVIRNSEMLSFDISAIANSYAPANNLTPNGLTGEEACQLMRFAGLSPNINSIGIYGYVPEKDLDSLTAKQISQMLWYVLDGRSRGRREAGLDER
jgi:arginase family enzyme